MRCCMCGGDARRVNSEHLCPRCVKALDRQRVGLRRDRFWVIMVGIPLLLMAGLGTVLVVFAATAR